MASIEDRVEKLVKPAIENIGYSVYDVEYCKEGKNYYLRIFIDNENGINLTDCEKVSNEINDILDEANYIKEQYYLEVSSPGIERVLKKDKHLEQNIGNEINIKLFKKDENGKKEYQGILESFNNDTIKMKQGYFLTEVDKHNREQDTQDKNKEKDIEIERKNIAQIKTVYNW